MYPSNGRPISLRPLLFKALERVVVNQMNDLFGLNKIL